MLKKPFSFLCCRRQIILRQTLQYTKTFKMELSTISDVKLEEFKDSRFVVPERVTFKQVNDYLKSVICCKFIVQTLPNENGKVDQLFF